MGTSYEQSISNGDDLIAHTAQHIMDVSNSSNKPNNLPSLLPNGKRQSEDDTESEPLPKRVSKLFINTKKMAYVLLA